MVIADGLAIMVGVMLGKTLPEKLITRISGVLVHRAGRGNDCGDVSALRPRVGVAR